MYGEGLYLGDPAAVDAQSKVAATAPEVTTPVVVAEEPKEEVKEEVVAPVEQTEAPVAQAEEPAAKSDDEKKSDVASIAKALEENYSVATWFYQASLLIINGIFVSLVLIRRKQLRRK